MSTLALPIAVDDLLHGKSVEWERLEFKAGWNPQDVLHSICAFANDFHNLGGGYILIGVEEREGQPVLPPKGIAENQVDEIQKEILRLGHQAIQPAYHPLTSPITIGGKMILAIWAPGGETRPYKARVSLSETSSDWAYYIRRQSSTVRARNDDERELIGLAATVPFDDRYNQRASMEDLSPRLIEEFLREVGSDLADDASTISIEALGRQMNVVGGRTEAAFPKNIGLMFFNEHPESFFPATQIDVVWFPDGPGGDKFEEKVFTGPLARMTRDALSHIQRNYLKETIIKHPNRAEADRIWNFPYAAVEEALVNAVYHRSYEEREPIEVRISPDELVILSFPGPDRSIRMADLRMGKAISRRYRNRRIGEFFKELDLTEGRSTGIPKIMRAVERNGSPQPIFETDEEHSYFLFRLPVHPESLGIAHDEAHDEAHELSEIERKILEACEAFPRGSTELLSILGYSSRTGNYKKAIVRLLEEVAALERTLPEAPRSKKQQYRLTRKGMRMLKAIRK
ncbi:MAG: putative DNA binding domain-containing protein [bacterium]|nr:putative DNA binding domain-containing protein [bacterium]